MFHLSLVIVDQVTFQTQRYLKKMYVQTRGVVCQHGSGGNNFLVYRGVSRQYGYGLGSMFKTALRTVMPVLKPVAKAGLQSIKQVAKDQGIHGWSNCQTRFKQ